jgi:hypothetical protein
MRGLSKMPADPREAAALTARLAKEESEALSSPQEVVSQYLATIGRRGGIKGGKARANSLTKARKKEIARLAAQARWKDKRS